MTCWKREREGEVREGLERERKGEGKTEVRGKGTTWKRGQGEVREGIERERRRGRDGGKRG